MAPTEYRVIAKRASITPLPSLRGLVAAGEALNPEVLRAFKEVHRARDPRRLRPDRDRPAHRHPAGPAGPARLDGPARCPASSSQIEDGELVLDRPEHRPDLLRRLPRRRAGARGSQPWRTGDRVQQDEDGYLYFEGRTDDVIISAGYRIGPFEVESALVSHEAVAEAAVVAAPDEERGAVVRAVVVLRDGFSPATRLAAELQDHVKHETAPYKYPRIVDFAQSCRRPPAARSSARCCADQDGAESRWAR